MKTESNGKYTPILLYQPETQYDFPRMKPSYPRKIRSKEEEDYLVSSSTLRCLLIGKRTIYFLLTNRKFENPFVYSPVKLAGRL